ncbi:unnamed protein product [Moneuplotes crassus]|uniref:Uncharacterized protein n=1 Tax=Euplotes crassus TaxID=5936 RepID=A0AAD1XST6_EUPCR|nr:unnamed protein product [Moneuplotes crassus]
MTSLEQNQDISNHGSSNGQMHKQQQKSRIPRYMLVWLGGIAAGIVTYLLIVNTPLNEMISQARAPIEDFVKENIPDYLFICILGVAALFVIYTCIRAPQFFKNARVNRNQEAGMGEKDWTRREEDKKFVKENRDIVHVISKEEHQQESGYDSPKMRMKFYQKSKTDKEKVEDSDYIPINMIHQSFVDSGRKN